MKAVTQIFRSPTISAPWILGLSLLLASMGQLLLASDLNMRIAVAFYGIACSLFIYALRNDPAAGVSQDLDSTARASPWDFYRVAHTEIVLLIVLISVAAFFRLFRIDTQPGSLWIDETFAAVNALEIIEGKQAPIWDVTPLNRFQPEWVKTPNLYLYYVIMILKIFGSGHLALKMVSVLPAIAGVIVAYFLFRAISDSMVALVSTFLLAVSHWNVTTSRWGWDAVLMSCLQMTCYYFLVKGFSTGRKSYFAVAGVIIGLSLYTYVASWIALATALCYLTFRLASDWQNWRARVLYLVTFLIPCLIVFSPLAGHYLANPRDLTVRTTEVSILTVVNDTKSYEPVLENAKKYSLMFNYAGSPDPRHNLPKAPQLDFVTAIFFVLGFTYYAWNWRRSHNFLFSLWFAFGLLAGFLTHPTDAPNCYRTSMIAPIVCLFAGTSMSVFNRAFLRRVAGRLGKLASALASLALLGTIAVENYRIYFIKRPASPEVWRDENMDWGIPRIVQYLRAETPAVFLDPLLLWDSVIVNSWYLHYRAGKLFEPGYHPSHIFRIPEKPIEGAKSASYLYYIVPPPVLPLVQKIFPEAQSAVMSTPFGKDLYVITRLRTDDWVRNLESANKREIAAFAYDMARLYQNRANSFIPSSPVRHFLQEQSAIELSYAKQLDPSLTDEKSP